MHSFQCRWAVLAILASALPVGLGAQVHVVENPSATFPAPASTVKHLPDPPAAEIPQIIAKFTAKERLFRQLLKHSYTYTESIRVDTVDDDGNSTGDYEQVNDIQFSNEGERHIVCTFCPQPTLRDIVITAEDIDDFFNTDMYTLSIDELPEYDVRYVDHEPLDQLTAYKFEIRPKQLVKGHRYFQGTVWVDDRDLAIVKSFGKAVPDEFDKHGRPTNTFLPFETYRQPIDGKYWFPVYTHTDAMLGDAHVKMVIRFKDYKQFRATGRIVSIQAPPTTPPPKKP